MTDKYGIRFLGALGVVFLSALAVLRADPIPLNRATFTDITNEVVILKSPVASPIPAHKNDVVSAPELVRTGQRSRAELRAPDNTITRVGANTVLSFNQDGRGINLQQGSVLFHSPEGKGGGTIQTAAVTAAVTGTTIIVSATRDGGFKFLVLEGHGKATSGGRTVNLNAGQLVFVLPHGAGFSPVMNYLLQKQTRAANLVGGFDKPLDSLPKIENAIAGQQEQIGGGDLIATNLLITDDGATDQGVPVVDTTVLQINGGSGMLALLQAAFAKDIIQANSVFDPNQLFDFTYFTTGAALLGQSAGNFSTGDMAYLAHNMTITQSNLNLSQFSGVTDFSFVVSGNLTLPGTFVPVQGPGSLDFMAPLGTLSMGSVNYNGGLSFEANALNIAPSSFISANGYLDIRSYSNLTLSQVSTSNNATNFGTDISTDAALSITGGNFFDRSHIGLEASGDSVISAATFSSGNISTGDVNFYAGGNLTAGNSSVTANNISFDTAGDLSLPFDTLQSGSGGVYAYAGGNMTIVNPVAGPARILPCNSVDLSAVKTMTVTGSTFNVAGSYNSIRMSATQIVLNAVTFPDATIDLYTKTGNWSSSGIVTNGVYFNGCQYAGVPITGNGTAGVVATSGTSHQLISH